MSASEKNMCCSYTYNDTVCRKHFFINFLTHLPLIKTFRLL